MLYHAGPSSLVLFRESLIITDSDLQAVSTLAIKRDTEYSRGARQLISSRLRHSSVVPTVLPLASLAVRFATTGKPLHKRNLLKTSKTADMYNKCPVLKDLRFN